MNDSKPKRGRRRRGGSRRKKPQAASANNASPPQGTSKKEGGRQKTAQPKTGRRNRQENAPRREKTPPRETFAQMVQAYPPDFKNLPEFIKCCRNLRGKNEEYSDDEFFYFIATSVEALNEDKFDELFNQKYSEPLKEIRLKEGLEETQYWKPDDPSIPDNYRQLLEEFRTEKREALSKAFQNFGEASMGKLVEEDYAGYSQRKETGKTTFYSRHKFDAVQMEASEMDLSLQADFEEESQEPSDESVDE